MIRHPRTSRGFVAPAVAALALALVAARPVSSSPLAPRLRSFPIPTQNSEPIEITLGPDGNLWFTEQNASRVARVTPEGEITEFPFPTFAFPNDITAGPDGAVWVAEGSGGLIGRVAPDGHIQEVRFDLFDASLGITTGPDGNIWFTSAGHEVWRLDLATRDLAVFPVPDGKFPGDITAGADGNLWFKQTDSIGRLSPDGQYTEFGVGQVTPFAVTTGPDGNVWFTERFGHRIGKISPGGQFTFYATTLNTLESIVTGPDGNLWFTSFGDNRIARITTDGVITPLPEIPGSAPTGISAGPGRRLWFLGYGNDRVYRLAFPPPGAAGR